MVKYIRKKYGMASKKQFKYIASHYLNYKIKAPFQADFNQNDGLTGDISVTFSNVLDTENGDFAALSKHFLLYRITGIAITAVPMMNGDNGNQFNMKRCGFAMSILNINDDASWQGITKSPNAVLLGDQKVTKYVRINSGWFATNNQAVPSMKICVGSRGAPLAGQYTINYLVTMYVSFKSPA